MQTRLLKGVKTYKVLTHGVMSRKKQEGKSTVVLWKSRRQILSSGKICRSQQDQLQSVNKSNTRKVWVGKWEEISYCENLHRIILIINVQNVPHSNSIRDEVDQSRATILTKQRDERKGGRVEKEHMGTAGSSVLNLHE